MCDHSNNDPVHQTWHYMSAFPITHWASAKGKGPAHPPVLSSSLMSLLAMTRKGGMEVPLYEKRRCRADSGRGVCLNRMSNQELEAGKVMEGSDGVDAKPMAFVRCYLSATPARLRESRSNLKTLILSLRPESISEVW